MPYIQQTWVDDTTVVDASRLNYMEEGIAAWTTPPLELTGLDQVTDGAAGIHLTATVVNGPITGHGVIPAWWTATLLKTDTASPYASLSNGFYSETLIGDASHPTIGTAQGFTSVMTVTRCGDGMSEHSPYMGWLRYDAPATPGRAWFTDFSLHGAIGVQQSLLTGINMFTNNYYNGSPSSGSSSAIHVISRPGTGGGADAAHQAATTYPMDVGIGISGKSGVPATALTRGFTTALRIGNTGGGWGSGFGSRFGYGIDVSDWELIGVHVSARFAGTAADQPSFAATNVASTDAAMQTAIATDVVPRMRIRTSGAMEWGAGGASAVDTGLYRATAQALKVDKVFSADWSYSGAATLGGLVTSSKAGIPADADCVVVANNLLVVDTTNNRLYVRVAGTWKYATLT